MILSRKLSDALNEQINAEMWSANLYMSMYTHFVVLGLDGCAHWMRKQSEEELEHAYSLINYSIKRGGQVVINPINSVPTAWGSPLEIFEHVYKHETYISELIDKLVDLASSEKDKATQDFLWSFVREQVEEEATAKNIAEKLKSYGEHHIAILDHLLSKRC
ncbi:MULTISPECIES: ferritin [Bacteroidales]|uniref:ferritin n=1 Tax=Parabacteroides bouchesdurhonensis TaxID=1936995 RepID=UPI000E4E83FE|nr:ferritin [Bacteroides sp. AM07-16]